MNPESCSICKCWLAHPEGHHGVCRRYPPKLYMELNKLDSMMTTTPMFHDIWTKPDYWCGEWRHK